MTTPVSLWSLFATFLRIGSSAFGGFMALISVVQSEVVERRRWLRAEDMLDGVSLATVLPGPVAVNVVTYVGFRLRGARGALVAACGVILPAFLLILGLSAAYFAWGSMPAMTRVFQGFVPAVASIILVAAWNMGRKAAARARTWPLVIAAAGLLLAVGGFWLTLGIIAASGVVGVLFFRQPSTGAAANEAPRKSGGRLGMLVAQSLPLSTVAPFLNTDFALTAKLFTTFAGMSLLLFGGGYVFIPLIQEAVVDGQHWVTVREFVDGIALGQITPGPILISATFIGYKVAGLPGAVAATLGIFGPSAVLMLIGSVALDRIRNSVWIQAALAGVRPAVVGMIAAAGVSVGLSATAHWASILIFVAVLVAQLRFRLDVVWLIPASGLAGFLLL